MTANPDALVGTLASAQDTTWPVDPAFTEADLPDPDGIAPLALPSTGITDVGLLARRPRNRVCPRRNLVGSYDEVAPQLAAYWAAGHRTIILDSPRDEEDLSTTAEVLNRVALPA